jgi:hypothetical protein
MRRRVRVNTREERHLEDQSDGVEDRIDASSRIATTAMEVAIFISFAKAMMNVDHRQLKERCQEW